MTPTSASSTSAALSCDGVLLLKYRVHHTTELFEVHGSHGKIAVHAAWPPIVHGGLAPVKDGDDVRTMIVAYIDVSFAHIALAVVRLTVVLHPHCITDRLRYKDEGAQGTNKVHASSSGH